MFILDNLYLQLTVNERLENSIGELNLEITNKQQMIGDAKNTQEKVRIAL